MIKLFIVLQALATLNAFLVISQAMNLLLKHMTSQDHHDFSATDLSFDDDKPIIMTEKDAVKCRAFANDKMWYIPVEASISGELEKHILTKLVGSKPHG